MARDMTLGSAAVQSEERRSARSPGALVLRALLKRKLAVLGIVYITIFYVAGIFAPLVAPYGYTEQNLESSANWKGPTGDHPFGTDRLGRDVLSRCVYAARTTVIITILTVVTGGLFIGPALGLLAGYRRGLF